MKKLIFVSILALFISFFFVSSIQFGYVPNVVIVEAPCKNSPPYCIITVNLDENEEPDISYCDSIIKNMPDAEDVYVYKDKLEAIRWAAYCLGDYWVLNYKDISYDFPVGLTVSYGNYPFLYAADLGDVAYHSVYPVYYLISVSESDPYEKDSVRYKDYRYFFKPHYMLVGPGIGVSTIGGDSQVRLATSGLYSTNFPSTPKISHNGCYRAGLSCSGSIQDLLNGGSTNGVCLENGACRRMVPPSLTYPLDSSGQPLCGNGKIDRGEPRTCTIEVIPIRVCPMICNSEAIARTGACNECLAGQYACLNFCKNNPSDLRCNTSPGFVYRDSYCRVSCTYGSYTETCEPPNTNTCDENCLLKNRDYSLGTYASCEGNLCVSKARVTGDEVTTCSSDADCGGGAPTPPTQICGNGIKEGTEQCDNGVNNGQVCTAPYGGSCEYCTMTCTIATVQGPRCGDGICDPVRENSVSCPADCALTHGVCTALGQCTLVTGQGVGECTPATAQQDCDEPVYPYGVCTSPNTCEIRYGNYEEFISNERDCRGENAATFCGGFAYTACVSGDRPACETFYAPTQTEANRLNVGCNPQNVNQVCGHAYGICTARYECTVYYGSATDAERNMCTPENETIDCAGYCGDGVIDYDVNEFCDGTNLSGFGCDDFDEYTGGTLTCYPPGHPFQCHFDTNGCTPDNPGVCGNGVVNDGEECDGNDYNGKDVTDFGLSEDEWLLRCHSSGHPLECKFYLSRRPGSSIGGENPDIIETRWEDWNGNVLRRTHPPSYKGDTLFLVTTTRGINDGANIIFEIYEDDTLDDDFIRTLTTTVNNNFAKVEWEVTQADMNAAKDLIFNEYADGVAEFYFIAKVAGKQKTSEIRPITDDWGQPRVRIASPIHRQIYYTGKPIRFYAEVSGGNGPLTLTWSIDDTLPNPNQNDFSHTYRTDGQKVITVRVTDSVGAWSEDQISILLLSSPGILAFINTPAHREIVVNNEYNVFYNLSDSYAVNSVSRADGCADVSCLAGVCPRTTINTPEGCSLQTLPVSNTPHPQLFNNLMFNLTFDSSYSFQKPNNYTGIMPYPIPSKRLDDKNISLLLNYTGGSIPGFSGDLKGSHFRKFTLLGDNQCLFGGDYLILTSNGYLIDKFYTVDSSYCMGIDGLYETADDCCPPGMKCLQSAGRCVETNYNKCADYKVKNTQGSEPGCIEDPYNVRSKDPAWAIPSNKPLCESFGWSCYCDWGDPLNIGTNSCYLRKDFNGGFSDNICSYSCLSSYEYIGECDENGQQRVKITYNLDNVNPPGCVSVENVAIVCGPEVDITIICAKSFLLEFFNKFQIVIAIAMLIAVYAVYLYMKKRKNSKSLNNNSVIRKKKKK